MSDGVKRSESVTVPLCWLESKSDKKGKEMIEETDGDEVKVPSAGMASLHHRYYESDSGDNYAYGKICAKREICPAKLFDQTFLKFDTWCETTRGRWGRRR